MRRKHWWSFVLLLFAVCAQVYAQGSPTVCEDESCHCDSFTRVLCNCTKEYDEVTFRPDGPYQVPSGTTGIIVNNCARVYFLQDTVKNLLRLQTIELNNVRHVYLNERSLSWSPYPREYEMANPGLKITIRNSTVNEIGSHSIKGRIENIIITDSKINLIKPFAFSSLIGLKSIELINNVYDNIEIQAFKKFTVYNFIIHGGKTHTLPSRFLSDVEVLSLFRMDSFSVKYISSVAFLVTGPKRVLIERNTIDTLEGDCFHITTRGPITFRNNTVKDVRKGAFLGFSAGLEVTSIMGRQELLLDNNTFTEVAPVSLLFNQSSISLRIDGLNLNSTCTCELANFWQTMAIEQGGLNCWYILDEHYISLSTFVDTRCGVFKQTFWILMVVGVVIILAVGVLILVFVVMKENDKKKKVQIVMPDGKTYRETELHIVVERAELLTTDL